MDYSWIYGSHANQDYMNEVFEFSQIIEMEERLAKTSIYLVHVLVVGWRECFSIEMKHMLI